MSSFTLNTIAHIGKKITKPCPDCKENMIEKGTTGKITYNKKTQQDEYERTHHWFCEKCGERKDQLDCKCDKGSCLGNNHHHGTDHTCIECGKVLTCDMAHGAREYNCGHMKRNPKKYTESDQ